MKTLKFNVPCNWDPSLIDELSIFTNNINYMYGKINSDYFSGGRARCEIKDASREQAKEFIKECSRKGIEFNYLINGTYLKNEFSQSNRNKIIKEIEWIEGLGVKHVTISIPYIARLIKRYFPHIKIVVSIFSHVRSQRQIDFWEEIGADCICLDRHLVRNYNKIKQLTGKNNIDLSLLVNDPCILNCGEELYHDNLMSRASLYSSEYSHYCSFTCFYQFLRFPYKIFTATFIRPEDLYLYSQIGINIFKIVDRNRTTKFITNAVKAYSKQSYEGNLIDLLSIFSSFDRNENINFNYEQKKFSLKIADNFWYALPKIVDLFIDNKSMDGFAEKWISTIGSCEDYDCNKCGICMDMSANYLRYDQQKIDNAFKCIDKILTAYSDERGHLFRFKKATCYDSKWPPVPHQRGHPI